MSQLELDPLREGGVELRMLEVGDLPATLAWRNDPRSRSWFHSDAIIEWNSHRAWFDAYRSRPDDHVFIVVADGTPAAQVSLYGIADRRGEFGRLLVDPDRRGEGLGSVASRLCLGIADEFLHLDLVHLEVKNANAVAIRIYASLGFEIAQSPTVSSSSTFMVRHRPDSTPPTQGSAAAIN